MPSGWRTRRSTGLPNASSYFYAQSVALPGNPLIAAPSGCSENGATSPYLLLANGVLLPLRDTLRRHVSRQLLA